MRLLSLPVFALLVALVGLESQASLIVNGSFEDGTNAPVVGFRTLNAVNTDLTGWTVTSGSIDWIGDYWQAADGDRSIDLGGNGDGTIASTSFATIVGQQYELSFAMAGNPDNGPIVKTLEVDVASLVDQTFTFDTTDTSRSDMGWVTKTLVFTATSTTTTLSFENKTDTAWGVALDDVEVNAIPEPATLAVWTAFAGIGAIAAGRRKRRKS